MRAREAPGGLKERTSSPPKARRVRDPERRARRVPVHRVRPACESAWACEWLCGRAWVAVVAQKSIPLRPDPEFSDPEPSILPTTRIQPPPAALTRRRTADSGCAEPATRCGRAQPRPATDSRPRRRTSAQDAPSREDSPGS